MPRPQRHPKEPVPRAARRRPEPPASTRAHDTPEFVERVQAESRKRFGGTIEEIVTAPELREIAYDVLATGLRQKPGVIPADVLEVVERLRAVGITATPGSCDTRDMPAPMKLGFSLTDDVLEERYGTAL
jgi:hypothetical protein